MSVNRVTLVGRLGNVPQYYTGDKRPYVTFSLATHQFFNVDGKKKTRTDWHKIVVFNQRCVAFACTYLDKGLQVFIEGCLQNRKYIDSDGLERFTTEIILPTYTGDIKLLQRSPKAVPEADVALEQMKKDFAALEREATYG